MAKNRDISGLGGALRSVVERIQDPLFLSLIGVAILLVIAASVRTNWQVMAIVAGAFLVLFISILLYLTKESERNTANLIERVTSRIVYCIRQEDYLDGPDTQQDFAGVLVGKIVQLQKRQKSSALGVMILELAQQFDLPEEWYEGGINR